MSQSVLGLLHHCLLTLVIAFFVGRLLLRIELLVLLDDLRLYDSWILYQLLLRLGKMRVLPTVEVLCIFLSEELCMLLLLHYCHLLIQKLLLVYVSCYLLSKGKVEFSLAMWSLNQLLMSRNASNAVHPFVNACLVRLLDSKHGFFTLQLLIETAVVTVEQLLTAVEWPAAVVLWEDLEVSVYHIVVSAHIYWRIVANYAIGCCLIKLTLLVWRVHWQVLLIQMLIQLVSHRIRTLQNLVQVVRMGFS